jgi:hypothetical protein
MKPASPRPSLCVAASTVVPRLPATARSQMSPVNGFDGRGRDASRARWRAAPVGFVPTRGDLRRAWAQAMEAEFGCREVCAAAMEVTFQTACNWFDEFSTPTGDKVIRFALCHPTAYAGMLAEVAK